LVAEVEAGGGQEPRLAGIGDELRLVLMEITELGTAMYSVRSGEASQGPTESQS
jgi:hypothetical protein